MSEDNKNELNGTPEENVNEEENTMQTSAAEEESAVEQTQDGNNAEQMRESANNVGDIARSAENIQFEEVVGTEPDRTADKKKLTKLIVIVVAAVVVIAAVLVFAVNGKNWFNSYNKNYVDVTGRTAGEVADMSGMAFSDFLEYYDLPENLPESTSEYATMYTIPAGTYAELFMGRDFADMAELAGWGDDVTEETPVGEAFDKITLNNYCGEENVESFKEEYGLGDDVTGDTLYGEVRHQVELALQAQYQAMLNPTEEPEEEATEAAADAAAAGDTAADTAAANEADADAGTADTAADADADTAAAE